MCFLPVRSINISDISIFIIMIDFSNPTIRKPEVTRVRHLTELKKIQSDLNEIVFSV